MSCKLRRFVAIMIAVLFVIMEPAAQLAGFGVLSDLGAAVYASVGSVADGEDITYDKNGGLLASMGFDTSKMPEGFDADATTNPYGSNVSTLNEVEEMVLFHLKGEKKTELLGHDKALDGVWESFEDTPISKDINFLHAQPFVMAAKCDINGDGRDSALAIAYTYYNYEDAMAENPDLDRNIYIMLYDPKTGNKSDPIAVGSFKDKRMVFDYMVQSQIEITAGDYDKDSVDEIAVYSPAGDESGRARVVIYDLIEGTDCENPLSANSWRESWNYVLPKSTADIINYSTDPQNPLYAKNIYNNIDLASGDADNDGVCDMIVSYGASDTDYAMCHAGKEMGIERSIPSKSVLLYGSADGQMLKDQQEISYAGNDLIRVSFAFGDINGDGNEDMFIGGQLMSEQGDNTSRFIGKYSYDSDAGGMIMDSGKDLQIISGKTDDSGQFSSSNGWDGEYHSAPLMKVNLTVGDVMGSQSTTKIYMDSVLISYDNDDYEIVDELEDNIKEDGKYKGSHVFDDMMGYYADTGKQSAYYEYGADAGNFTGADNDTFIINRVSIKKNFSAATDSVEAQVSVLNSDNKGVLYNKKTDVKYDSQFFGSPVYATTADTDKDSMVATYTGEHYIQYEKPKVAAVLASAPYFKDVADYDEGDLLNWCSTTYGTSAGSSDGYTHTYSRELGAFVNGEVGNKWIHGIANTQAGEAREETWGYENTREYEIAYSTAGGEDAVVMSSKPIEHYVYDLECVSVDDDGNYSVCYQKMIKAFDHNPVTQTLTLDDYMEIQENNTDDLPDVTKYLKSIPGDPSSYPKNENDLSPDAKAKLGDKDYGADFEGIAYGSGTISQSISTSTTTVSDDVEKGVYAELEIGLGVMAGEEEIFYASAEAGFHVNVSLTEGATESTSDGVSCSGTVSNMPRAAKGYGYDFDWKLFKYDIKEAKSTFPVVTYIVNDVTQPPVLPASITQDFDGTTDSQIKLDWTYTAGEPQEFDIYRYEDFPQGGGDKLIGTVAGSDYRVAKDSDGNTLKDSNGHFIREYTFTDTDLTADTKYSYRMKVKRMQAPPESIFSPVIEARTDVGTKPELTLSADNLTIYPDNTYEIKVNLKDPENYQKDISYQWQKYNEKKRTWEDVKGCDKVKLHFYNCSDDDEGQYRCRVNLIRKVESHPQYITAYTESCMVVYSLRDVLFDEISIGEGTGKSETNTSVSVKVYNSSQASLEKPTGKVIFTFEGPNGEFQVGSNVDEETGIAKVNSIEDLGGTTGAQSFVDGGYKVTARYYGNAIFYPADYPDEYHYLRNIDECMFLSTRSTYQYGDDIMPTTGLYDYKKDSNGKITRTDHTNQLSLIKFYAANEQGEKTSGPIVTVDLSYTDGKARVPLNKELLKRMYVEGWTEGGTKAAAGSLILVRKIQVDLDIQDKLTGTGSMLDLVSSSDVKLSNDVDADDKIIMTDDGNKSLADLMLFKYYEQNGDYMFDSTAAPDHKDEFIPASYNVKVELTGDDAPLYYTPTFNGARFMVVGAYYHVSAGPSDKSAGRVQMISPDDYTDFSEKGYAGGTNITLKAIPNPGYEISKWTIDECGTSRDVPGDEKITYAVRSKNTEGNGEIVITAVMIPKDNKLTYGTIGNGSISVSPDIGNGAVVMTGTKLTFEAVPDPGWKFEEWRWANIGGNNMVSGGVPAEDGSCTKTYTMPDNSANVYAVFMKDTIDIAASNDLEVTYLNDGSDPHYETGEVVVTEKGKNVPKGVTVTVRTKPGIVLAPGNEWKVTVATDEGIAPVEVQEVMSAGRPACKFDLPENATSCLVEADTSKGRYSVSATAEDVTFVIKVDGVEMGTGTVDAIESGSQVDITATPARGKVIKNWIVNGEEVDSTDTTYSVNITDNMNVSAVLKDDEEVKLTLSTEGGGKGGYVITAKDGNLVDGTFQGDPQEVTAYKDEAVTFSVADDDTDHTMTAVMMDGEPQELDGGTFTIKQLEKDTEIVARFGANAYYDLTFHVDGVYLDPEVMDEDGNKIESGGKIRVEKGGSVKFSVAQSPGISCFVTMDGEDLTPYNTGSSGNKNRYDFQVDNIAKNEDIIVSDHKDVEITSEEELIAYFETIKDNPGNAQPSAVLMNDIEMSGEKELPLPSRYRAVFDGKGHTISGLRLGSESNYVSGFLGIFGDIESLGTVKNLTISDAVYYVNMSDPTKLGLGLLSHTNGGTISDVAVLDSEFHEDAPNYTQYRCGILAYMNNGTIRNCMVKNATITSTRTLAQYVGSMGAAYNPEEGEMTANYFEDLSVKGSDDDGVHSAHGSIIVQDESNDNGGVFNNNFFKAYYSEARKVKDSHGISIYSRTEDPDDVQAALAEASTPVFVRKLAYDLNHTTNEKAWGTTGEDDNVLNLTALGGESCKAPAKITYTGIAHDVTYYLYPGRITLAGEEEFGGDTPNAWQIGDVQYAPGAGYDIEDDVTATAKYELDDYVATLSAVDDLGEIRGTIYYNDLAEALKDAEAHKSVPGKQQLQITGNCELESKAIVFDEQTQVVLKQGSMLALKSSVQLTNMGMITVENGAVVHKYGSLFNQGTVTILEGAEFHNYGSAFDNKGMVTGKERIICEPHIFGEWTYSDKPDDNGNWTRSSTCTVCDKDVTEEIAPDPPVSRVVSIDVFSEPEMTSYEVGNKFSQDGLQIVAALTDGTRTAITKYKMYYSPAGIEEELKDGDPFDVEGYYDVTVKYGTLTCTFKLAVFNTADLLTLTDEDDEEITEAEMEPGDVLAVKASLKSRLPYNTQFVWETSDENVAALSNDTGAEATITTDEPGNATITVTVVDEKGVPIQAIDVKTIQISNVSHITSISILGGDVSIDKGDSYELKLEVEPENATDTIEWSSSDENVAVVDENGVVTGTGGGSAEITVTTSNGLSDSKKVSIYEKANDLVLEPDELTMDAGDFDVISARVMSANANGEVVWTVDDSSTAGFAVTNEETGEIEIVDTVTTKLSADGSDYSDAYVIVTGVNIGNATVTATTESESGDMIEKTCLITIKESDKYVHITHNGVWVSGLEMKLDIAGNHIQLGADSSEEDDSFTWTAIDDGSEPVLKINSNGLVTFKRKGTAVIKLESDITHETDVFKINVIIRATGVELSDSDILLEEGGKYTLGAKLLPDGAEGKVLWSSSDQSIAKVSSDGVVTGVREGEAIIQAIPDTTDSEPAFCKVTVHSSKLTVKLSKKTFIYDGKKKVPKVTVLSGKTVLASGITESDANVILLIDVNSKRPGRYEVTAIARDQRYGSGGASYTIKVKPTSIKKITKGSRKFTVKWKKVPKKNSKGYMVRYSTKKSMKDSKYRLVKGYNKTKLTVKNLKGGKKYYVQVRTFIKRGGVRYYSTWSKKKTVKTKK